MVRTARKKIQTPCDTDLVLLDKGIGDDSPMRLTEFV